MLRIVGIVGRVLQGCSSIPDTDTNRRTNNRKLVLATGSVVLVDCTPTSFTRCLFVRRFAPACFKHTHTVGKQPGHFASSSGAQMPVNISLTSFLGSRGVRLHVKSLSCNHHVGRLGCATAAGTLYFAGAGGLSRLRHR